MAYWPLKGLPEQEQPESRCLCIFYSTGLLVESVKWQKSSPKPEVEGATTLLGFHRCLQEEPEIHDVPHQRRPSDNMCTGSLKGCV